MKSSTFFSTGRSSNKHVRLDGTPNFGIHCIDIGIFSLMTVLKADLFLWWYLLLSVVKVAVVADVFNDIGFDGGGCCCFCCWF